MVWGHNETNKKTLILSIFLLIRWLILEVQCLLLPVTEISETCTAFKFLSCACFLQLTNWAEDIFHIKFSDTVSKQANTNTHKYSHYFWFQKNNSKSAAANIQQVMSLKKSEQLCFTVSVQLTCFQSMFMEIFHVMKTDTFQFAMMVHFKIHLAGLCYCTECNEDGDTRNNCMWLWICLL